MAIIVWIGGAAAACGANERGNARRIDITVAWSPMGGVRKCTAARTRGDHRIGGCGAVAQTVFGLLAYKQTTVTGSVLLSTSSEFLSLGGFAMTDDLSAALDCVDGDRRLQLPVTLDDAGCRIDRLLGRVLSPHFSRSYLSALIDEGKIVVDGRRVKPSYRVADGSLITGPLGESANALPAPEEMDITILYEDDDLIIVDKPPQLVIHPGTGSRSGTMVNGLLARYPELARVGRADRPGIVHRLDKDTTGVMAVARTNDAAKSLVNQFKAKTVAKHYVAVVWGKMPFDSDWIDLDLGPDPKRPQLRAVVREGGQPASTFYKVETRLDLATVVNVHPKTGRTHQIRVHLEHLGYPIISDGQYGRQSREAFLRWVAKAERKPIITRQALHAHRLEFEHPSRGERVTFEAPIPADMVDLIECLSA